MLHIDLFSGIGGFSYASDTVFKSLEHIFCDIDPFARAVTKKHWPEAKHYEDIRQLIADTENGKQTGLRLEWKQDSEDSKISNCYLVTGGFPCQPFSQAGRRKGTQDDRYLWPEMFRIIQLARPRWVIAENVYGLVSWNEGMVLEQVCTDLEAEGYEVQPFIIPAVAVNAPHRRDRVWIVANRKRQGHHGRSTTILPEQSGVEPDQQVRENSRSKSTRRNEVAFTNISGERLEGFRIKGTRSTRQRDRMGSYKGPDWDQNWTQVAAELCRVDDGLPGRVDGLELSRSAHRRERLKSLGNAIVPQIAIQIMTAIREYDR